jgi:hypothetical protein
MRKVEVCEVRRRTQINTTKCHKISVSVIFWAAAALAYLLKLTTEYTEYKPLSRAADRFSAG